MKAVAIVFFILFGCISSPAHSILKRRRKKGGGGEENVKHETLMRGRKTKYFNQVSFLLF